MFIVTLFLISRVWRLPNVHQIMNKMWLSFTMKYSLAIRSNDGLMDATAWMNLDGIISNEKSQHRRPCII
jgi:hypothetical protein